MIAAADLPWLLRAMPVQGVLASIEADMRALLTHPYDEYSIASPDGAGFDISPLDAQRVYIIRCCQAPAELDNLVAAVSRLETMMAGDAALQRVRSAGGQKGATIRRYEAAARDRKLMGVIEQIRRSNGGKLPKQAALAAMLVDRFGGGREAMRKRVSKLLATR